MKMKLTEYKLYFCISTLLLCMYSNSNLFAQKVSNVEFYQEGKNVVVMYSLDKRANVFLQISTNGGKTFSNNLQRVSGDVGENVSAGRNRIIWDVLSEREKLIGDKIVFQIIALSNSHNGYECVDLGLPSGTLWATCNVGANNPEDYGSYFAWGETRTKSKYDWYPTGNYKWGVYSKNNSYNYGMTKYNKSDRKTILESADDVASANLGGRWRMPTGAEQDELSRECIWTWTTLNGIDGYRVTSKKDANKFIFLPAAGYFNQAYPEAVGRIGYYWSSSLDLTSPTDASGLVFFKNFYERRNHTRKFGMPIRPVCPKNAKNK